jgi:hypothetical protein
MATFPRWHTAGSPSGPSACGAGLATLGGMHSSLASSLGICSLFFAGKVLAMEPGTAASVQQIPAPQAAAPTGAKDSAPASDGCPGAQQVRGGDLRPLCPGGTAVTAPVAAAPAPSAPPAPATREPAHDARRAGSRAESAVPAPISHEPGPTHWYGWQILASDAASLLVATVGTRAEGSASHYSAFGGLLGYAAAPPLIHLLHDQGQRALGSVGMRLGFPVAGAAIGVVASSGCVGDDEEDLCQVSWGALGFLIGTLSAIALDAALARESVPRQRVGLQLSPQILVSKREAQLGLSGSF